MREMINYLIEVNIVLLMFLGAYLLFLRNETNFKLMRYCLLAAIVLAIAVPMIHLNASQSEIPSIGQVVPEYWLPEVTVGTSPEKDANVTAVNGAYNAWQVAGFVYWTGIAIASVWLLMQIGYVIIMLRNAKAYRQRNLMIIESADDKPTFSFFNLIYIGKSTELTPFEKEQIIRHESIHARQLHSLDMLLITLVGILVWFNPLIRYFKKIFIQLHEFEADARAVENSDVNKYCSLLARVALRAHFSIASHFNESLTVKRIEMMKSHKRKMSTWKIAAVISAIAISGFIVACQDQVIDEAAKSTISQSGDYPAAVKKDMTAYMEKHPTAKLTYMEGDPAEITKFSETEHLKSRILGTYDVDKDGVEKKGILLSDIVQYADGFQAKDNVFMIVEHMPEFPGGINAFREFIGSNLKYPKAALDAGKSGTVYVSMVISQSGDVTDVGVIRGVDAELDAEAVRVISMLPKWTPGMQNGRGVKTRMTVPIKFGNNPNEYVGQMQPINEKMKVDYNVDVIGDETRIRGKVRDAEGKPLPGINVLIKGTTQGTVTDLEGNFSIETREKAGTLNFSFVGYDHEEVAFK